MAAYKSAPHTFIKDGVFYFVRRIPVDLQKHYTSRKIAYSLQTRSATVAAAQAIRACSQLDEYWFHLRAQDSQLPGRHMLRLNISKLVPSPQRRLATALEYCARYPNRKLIDFPDDSQLV